MRECRSRPTGRSGIRKRRPSRSAGATDRSDAPLRRPAARRPQPPLRLPARAERRSRQLGRAEGRAAREGRAASRRPRRGPPARLRRFRGDDSGRAVRRRHGRDLGPRHVRARSRRRRTAASPFGSTASGSTARGRSSPPDSTAIRRTGSSSARTQRTAPPARPALYRPMLATATDKLPAGDGWAFEPKWDGFRALAYVNGGDVTFRSRNDNDLTGRFASAARALARAVRSPSAVLDGEICALDENGRSGFGLLQQGVGTLVFAAFDVLERDGEPLCDRTYIERRRGARVAPRRDGRGRARVARRSTTERRSSGPRASTTSRASSRSAERLVLPARPPHRWSGAS